MANQVFEIDNADEKLGELRALVEEVTSREDGEWQWALDLAAKVSALLHDLDMGEIT